MPESLHGLGVSPGVASGPVARMAAPPAVPSDMAPGIDLEAEAAAAEQALDAVAASLQERADRASGDAAEVLGAQVLMAQDPALRAKVVAAVRAGQATVTAVDDSFADYRDLLAGAGGYLAQRVADLDDLRNRAVAVLLGVAMPGVPDPGHRYVLVAEDLAPADTATLDADQVLAIVTEQGGPTSHTAILAKSLGIPAVVACADAASLVDGQAVLVDGGEGSIVVEPDPATVEEALAGQQRQRALLAASHGAGRTADGHGVQLLVNIGGDKDLERAAAADAEGVGLFRTEFLFLERPDAPSVDEQREAYARVFAAFTGRKVVVRTLDAGADKPLAFVTTPDEPNPALGVRGLRTARRHPELLDEQLQAIGAAAQGSGADVWVMAPMVATAGEAAEFAGLARSHDIGMAGDGRGAGRRDPRPAHRGRVRLPVARHKRPLPVHLRCGPR